MTDEHEHAMKVWREAKRAHDNCPFGDSDAPDELAAAVIAADRAGLVARIAELESEVEVLADNGCHLDALCKQQEAEIERLRKELEAASDFIGNLDHTKAGEKVYRRIRAALKDTRND
jgi:predicted RNase H-like nuclease (RuvC/YqgF family)